jgi:hypothetical protein
MCLRKATVDRLASPVIPLLTLRSGCWPSGRVAKRGSAPRKSVGIQPFVEVLICFLVHVVAIHNSDPLRGVIVLELFGHLGKLLPATSVIAH